MPCSKLSPSTRWRAGGHVAPRGRRVSNDPTTWHHASFFLPTGARFPATAPGTKQKNSHLRLFATMGKTCRPRYTNVTGTRHRCASIIQSNQIDPNEKGLVGDVYRKGQIERVNQQDQIKIQVPDGCKSGGADCSFSVNHYAGPPFGSAGAFGTARAARAVPNPIYCPQGPGYVGRCDRCPFSNGRRNR